MARVYVGNLSADVQKEQLEDTFSKFGRIDSIWVARQPPGFAFVNYVDPRDADDACRSENGNPRHGWRVEVSTGGRGGGGRGRGGGPSQGRYESAPPGRDDHRGGRDFSRRSPSPRRRSRSGERRRSRSGERRRSRSRERRRSRSGERERRRSRSRERR